MLAQSTLRSTITLYKSESYLMKSNLYMYQWINRLPISSPNLSQVIAFFDFSWPTTQHAERKGEMKSEKLKRMWNSISRLLKKPRMDAYMTTRKIRRASRAYMPTIGVEEHGTKWFEECWTRVVDERGTEPDEEG